MKLDLNRPLAEEAAQALQHLQQWCRERNHPVPQEGDVETEACTSQWVGAPRRTYLWFPYGVPGLLVTALPYDGETRIFSGQSKRKSEEEILVAGMWLNTHYQWVGRQDYVVLK